MIKARAERDRARKVLTHALAYGRMKELVDEHSNAYRTADPFPHVVLDDVFDPELLTQVLAEFDAMAMDSGKWRGGKGPRTQVGTEASSTSADHAFVHHS